jgi:hypothetical protein
MDTGTDGDIFYEGPKGAFDVKTGTEFEINWRIFPVHRKSALRAALAGSSSYFKVERLNQEPTHFRNHNGFSVGISGALGWNPTFLFDGRLWSWSLEVMRYQRLYHPFGTWRKSLGRAFREARETIDKKFARVQQAGRVHDRQQRGNRQRHRRVEERREVLLKVAQPLWSKVQDTVKGTRGRPDYRNQLQSMLDKQRRSVSRRDMDWLMKQLQDGSGKS